jgi:phospholipase C
MNRLTARSLAALAVAVVAGCAPPPGRGVLANPPAPLDASEGARPADASGKIQHVVVIVQENRSFDNLFQGYPGADTRSYGYDSTGKKVTLEPQGLEGSFDPGHESGDYFAACDGTTPGRDCKMDGFDKESGGVPGTDPEYAYVPHDEIKPYFALASQYVLADRMFASQIDGSFISHQYIIAGQASTAVDNPSGTWGCEGGPSDTIATLEPDRSLGGSIPECFDNQTIGDELDAKGLPWRFYAGAVGTSSDIWSSYRSIDHIRYGPDWAADVLSPQTRFFDDVRRGKLAAVTWITPTCRNSDHASCGGKHGPDWVASLVDAVGKSKFWDTSAVFVFWDDWGGWYDHVPPPYEDYDGLGIRVPLLVISPYAKTGYVSHVRYEHGSILRFIEDQFDLARLSASDKRANSPAADCFDFSQPPRPFEPVAASRGASDFVAEPPDLRVPDAE